MTEHTKGPLRVGKGHAVVADHPVPEMSGSDAVEYYGGHLVAESVTAANARRLAACWNACDGFTTEELEAHTGPRLLRARLEGAFARIDELLSERNRVGIDISSAILSGIVPDRHPLRSRLELLANHHKHEQALAELLRRARRYVSPLSCPESEIQIVQSIVSSIDSVLAGQLPDPAVTVTETIHTAPERIWLQVGDQSHYHSEPFPSDTSEVSWCADSVMACEVPYVRVDLVGKVSERRITKPARVWGARFMPGIPEQAVIDAAYRYAEHESSQEEKEAGKINFDLLMAAVHKTVPEGWRLVPFNPTTDQWGGLARAIIFWMRSYPSNQHTPSTLVEFITSYGYAVPKWMEEESEFMAKNHVISKGTAASLIYKAMLADGPASQGGEPCATEPPLSSKV